MPQSWGLGTLEPGVPLHDFENLSRGTGRLVGITVNSASYIRHVLLQRIGLASILVLPQDRC